MTAHAIKAPATLTIGAIAAMAVIGPAALSAVLTVVAAHGTCSAAGVETAPSGAAKRTIPASYLSLYQLAARGSGVPWTVLAAIGSVESDHGRSGAPGVRSGLNRYGCCAGPMQFNTRDGPPSTWERYGVDGNRDGTEDVYDPDDAIPSAASYLRTLLRAADGNLSQALFGYNHSQAYVSDVLARARAYAPLSDQELAAAVEVDVTTGCADTGDLPAGPANLRAAQRVSSPRAFRPLPAWALVGGVPGAVDARLYGDVVWILRRYHLRVSAAREGGHAPTAMGPPSTSSPPTEPRRQSGTPPPERSPATSAGRRPAGAPAPAPPATSRPRSSSSAMTATPGTDRRAPVRVTAPAHRHLFWASPLLRHQSSLRPCE